MALTNSLNLNSNGIVTFNSTTGVFTGSALTNHNLLLGAANNLITSVAPSATAGIPFVSGGASADGSFTTAVVAGGGTGAVTLTGVLTGNGTSAFTASAVTQHDVLVGGAANAVTSVSPSTAGFVLTSNGTGSDPSFQVSTPGAMAPYINVTGASQTMAVNQGYIANDAGSIVTFTPPAVCAVGTRFAVAGGADATSGWTIDLTANTQTMNFGSVVGTNAVASSNQFDCVEFVCTVANTQFTLLDSVGSPNVT